MTGRDDTTERCRVMMEVTTRTVRSSRLSVEDAEDLIQEAMVRLIGTMTSLPENPATLAAYSRTTAKRVVVDHFRVVGRCAPYLNRQAFVDTVGEGDAGEDDTVARVVPSYMPSDSEPDQADFVAAFLVRLSESHWKTLMLCASSYTYEEIPEATKVSPGTVLSRIHYARKRAQRELKPLLP